MALGPVVGQLWDILGLGQLWDWITMGHLSGATLGHSVVGVSLGPVWVWKIGTIWDRVGF